LIASSNSKIGTALGGTCAKASRKLTLSGICGSGLPPWRHRAGCGLRKPIARIPAGRNRAASEFPIAIDSGRRLPKTFLKESSFTGIKVDRAFDMAGARFKKVPAADFKQSPDLDSVSRREFISL
jgi:hypothetical protein